MIDTPARGGQPKLSATLTLRLSHYFGRRFSFAFRTCNVIGGMTEGYRASSFFSDRSSEMHILRNGLAPNCTDGSHGDSPPTMINLLTGGNACIEVSSL